MRVRARVSIAGVVGALALIAASCAEDSSTPSLPSGPPNPNSFNFGPFAAGQSVTRTFTTAGTFGYRCNPHQNQGMTGSVNVNAAGSDSVLVQIGVGNALTFSPATASVKPNGTVRWVNVSSMTIHTVTSN